MHLNMTKNGLVDGLALDARSIAVTRDGDARYSLRAEAPGNLHVEIWTTRKSRTRVEPWPNRPDWIDLVLGATSELESLRANDCSLHLEQLDRGRYFLGFWRGDDHWALNLTAAGYIKTRVTPVAAV